MLFIPRAKIRIFSDIFTIFASCTIKSTKAIKRVIKIVWRSIIATVSILFAAALIIQLPQVQTFITDKLMDRVSENLDGDIIFEKIHFKPFTTLVLKNAAIIDRNPATDCMNPGYTPVDTLFSAEYIIARFTLDGLFRHEGLHIDNAYINNAQMTLVLEDNTDPDDERTITNSISRIFRLKKPDYSREYTNDKEIFHIKKVEIRNMGFAMKSCATVRPEYKGYGINWNDLDVKNIDLSARELKFKSRIMTGKVDKLSFVEKSGYRVKDISGRAKVGNGKTIVEDLHIMDMWSDVQMPLFMMSYKDVRAFRNFIEEVKIDGTIEDSYLDFETLSYFTPSLIGNSIKAEINGEVSGYVNDFRITDLDIDSAAGGFSGTVDGRLSGLPYISTTSLNARLNGFHLTTDGLGKFLDEWTSESLHLDRFAKGIDFVLNAEVAGLMDNLAVEARLDSRSGNAETDIRIRNLVNRKRPLQIIGTADTEDLDLGKVLGTDILGPVTISADLDASLGRDSELRIDTLKVDRLYANKYNYSGITVSGSISQDGFDGNITCRDPNLDFVLQGAFALSAKDHDARYQFVTDIRHADLNIMNIDPRGISQVSMRASADLTSNGSGDLRGKVDISDVYLENSMGKYEVRKVDLTSYHVDSTYTIRLNSDFADGTYKGTAPVTTFIKDLKDITLKKELPAIFEDSTFVWTGNEYSFDLLFSNTMDILSFLKPGLYIENGTSVNASLSREGLFRTDMQSNRLAIGRNYMKGINMTVGNDDNSLDGKMICEEIKVAAVSLKDSHLSLHGQDNHVGLKFDYNNHSEETNMGEIILHSTMSRGEEGLGINVEMLPSSVFINSKEWHLMPSSVDLNSSGMDIESFTIGSGEEKIILEGKVSKETADTLNLNLERFDISIINDILHKELGIRGSATGIVQLASPVDDKGILVDMICDSTFIADAPLGIVSIGSQWNEEEQNFGLHVKNELEGRNSLNLYGTLAPNGNIFDVTVLLDGFRIDYVQPVMKDIFSEMQGSISGRIDLHGPLSDLEISSRDTRLENSMLRIDYTNVPYYADGLFHLDETGVYFDNISLRDSYTGTGMVGGSINWDHFRDISFSTIIQVNEIEAINLDSDTGKGFYGRLFGTGNISLTGPSRSIMLEANATTAKTGQLRVPVSGTAATGKVTNLLQFTEKAEVEWIDPYEAMMEQLNAKEKKNSDFTVKLRVNAHQDVEVIVEIDESTGNVLSGRGNGTLDMTASADDFTIKGDYILNSGSYHFVTMGLVQRDFEIEDGSSIRFNGDIIESTLDINAVYRTKASLSTLLSDDSSISNKRTVNCGIGITDNLSNPQLKFSIQIPDLNPMIQSRVESALSTEDKVQRQFLSLILSNSFIPDEESGIVNNSSMLYSNVSEIIANQLNNIFQKLDIPLDLGLKYQPNESGNDLFDVAVTTQLFNNRVVVNGNIGNKQYNTGNTQNDVVGDLDIEIKLDRSGSVRLNLFSHSADQFSNYLDNSQRNGVGIMYQTEFNSFRTFFRNLFSNKAKRREAKMLEEQAMLRGERKNIEITKDDDRK